MMVLKWYGNLLETKPIRTKCITTFITFGAGDLLCQYFEIKSKSKLKYDYIRAFRQASFGFLISPYLHLQFSIIIPYLFPSGKRFTIIKSVIYHQTIVTGILIVAFFIYLDLLSGKSFDQTLKELRIKFFQCLFASWSVWPVLMTINFSIIPVHWRLLFANFCGLFWNGYLSYMQNVQSKNLSIKIQT